MALQRTGIRHGREEARILVHAIDRRDSRHGNGALCPQSTHHCGIKLERLPDTEEELTRAFTGASVKLYSVVRAQQNEWRVNAQPHASRLPDIGDVKVAD